MLIKSEKELRQYTGEFDALRSLTLSNTSPSGVRYCVEVMGQPIPSAVAGTPVHTTWPPLMAEQQRGQCLYPMDYVIHVHTGWDIEEISVGMWNIEPVLCDVPAAAVREALELQREIRLLEQVVTAGKATTVHSDPTPVHRKRVARRNKSTRLDEELMKALEEQAAVPDSVREARAAALQAALR